MLIHSWDTAIKAGSGNDYSVCLVVKQLGESHRIMDVWRDRVEYPQLKREFLRLAMRDQPDVILVEDKASGQSLIQDMKREGRWPIQGITPKGDKVTRLAQVSPMIEAQMVALPYYAEWLAEFEAELSAFPYGVYDDQVDAFSQYLNWVRARKWDGLGVRRL